VADFLVSACGHEHTPEDDLWESADREGDVRPRLAESLDEAEVA
jgi:hypothetical protein